MNINYDQAKATEIMPLLEEIEDVCVGNKKSHVILACIVMAHLVQDPDMPTDRLAESVKATTELIALHISQRDSVQTH